MTLLDEIGYEDVVVKKPVEIRIPRAPKPKFDERPVEKVRCNECPQWAHLIEENHALCTDCFLKAIRRISRGEQ